MPKMSSELKRDLDKLCVVLSREVRKDMRQPRVTKADVERQAASYWPGEPVRVIEERCHKLDGRNICSRYVKHNRAYKSHCRGGRPYMYVVSDKCADVGRSGEYLATGTSWRELSEALEKRKGMPLMTREDFEEMRRDLAGFRTMINAAFNPK